MAPVERERARARRGARHQNDVQLGSSPVRSVARAPRDRRSRRHPCTWRVRRNRLQRILAADATLAAVGRAAPPGSSLDRRSFAATCRARWPSAFASPTHGAPSSMLAADAGAIAAVVRQRAPDLLAALRREGCQFTAIRVRVQVRGDPRPTRESPCKSNR